MVLCAFRYCLGRMTYAPGMCVDYLIEHWQFIDEQDQKLILKETREAIRHKQAGMDCDIIEWERLLAEVQGGN